MNTIELKETLIKCKNNDFQLDEFVNLTELTTAMIREIGNVDPVLRDNLIYSSFCQMIVQGVYSHEELSTILKTCMDTEHLFFKIGEVETDSVFTRSFSSLIIGVILHVNLKKDFLTPDEIENIHTLLVKYLDQEQDIRGLVPEKGWAHSIAHVADALDELVKQPSLSTESVENVFTAILNKMTYDKSHFLYDEDERMVIPVMAMLKRGLDESVICERITELINDLKRNFSDGDQAYFVYRANAKQFLTSLFFHLDMKKQNSGIQNTIKQGMIEINQPYYQM